jgi:hypothetical protein
VEQIYPTLSDNPELKQTAMSVAEKLIAKGEQIGIAKGEQIGIAKGEQIGRIRATEELLGLPLSSTATLAILSSGELEARYAELMRASAKVFKR